MDILKNILRILDADMEEPTSYGWFHLVFIALVVGATVLLCVMSKKDKNENAARRLVLITSIVVIALEIYKQINYSFSYSGESIAFDYQWYIFPFQFCSMPMYIGLLAGLLKKGKLQAALYSFLATYALFGGLCVFAYPEQVFISTIGINIQSMVCHGLMIVVGAYLLYTGCVKFEHKTMLRAMSVFAVCIICAMVLNEIAYFSGLLDNETFNMFFISPHCEPSLPVYSLVQAEVPYPWCLFIYFAGFSAAAYIILLAAMGIHKLKEKR